MPSILVVDDDDGNRTGIVLAMEQHGYNAQEAENGKELSRKFLSIRLIWQLLI